MIPKYKTFAFTTTPFLNICKIEKSWNPKLLSCKAKYLILKKKIIDKVLFEIELLISSGRILLETNFEYKLLNVIPALQAGKNTVMICLASAI